MNSNAENTEVSEYNTENWILTDKTELRKTDD